MKPAVGQPAPHRAAADPPGIGRPARNAQILAAVLEIERLEPLPDQHLGIRSGAVGAPHQAAVVGVECGDPAPDPVLTAAVADHHFTLDHEGRHRDGLADVDVAEPRPPELLARPSSKSNRLPIKRVVEDPAVMIRGAAVHRVAAGDALSGGNRLRLIFPFERRAWLREVERVEDVRIGRDHEHRVLGHDRRRFLAAQHAQRERPRNRKFPDVPHVDLVQPAISQACQIPTWNRPAAILLGRARQDGSCNRATHQDRSHDPRGRPHCSGASQPGRTHVCADTTTSSRFTEFQASFQRGSWRIGPSVSTPPNKCPWINLSLTYLQKTTAG